MIRNYQILLRRCFSSLSIKHSTDSPPTLILRGLNIDSSSFHANTPTCSKIDNFWIERKKLILPGNQNLGVLYSFPTQNKINIFAPTFNTLIFEKEDPDENLVPINDPLTDEKTVPKMAITMRNWSKVRKHKMLKHKRRKRMKRDRFQYQKRKLKKNQKAEALFRSRMRDLIEKIEAFDPISYVNDTIERSNREIHSKFLPTGRRKYPHWSSSTSIDQLFGLPPGDYIDKRYGLPSEEDQSRVEELRKEYLRLYTVKKEQKSDES